MTLPEDDFILLSAVNTKLRDEYASFEEFCAGENADGRAIEERLSAIGYEYDGNTNSFR